jgi:hypothetical protein
LAAIPAATQSVPLHPRAWANYGDKALEKCAKNQPAAFCKMYVLLVPREMKLEHSQGVASLTAERLETAIAAIREMLDKREQQVDGQVIEGKAELVALPDALGCRMRCDT